MAPRVIPREGIFTADFGLSVLQSTVLNPVLTGSLLGALRYLPRETLLRWSQTLRIDLLSPTTVKTLKYLLIIGAARQANKVLSSLVLNNWERTTWDWKNEVAVVTGGSGGIGYHVAVGLAKHGITVAVVDVQEPKAPLRGSFPGCSHPLAFKLTAPSTKRALLQRRRNKHRRHQSLRHRHPQRPRQSYHTL